MDCQYPNTYIKSLIQVLEVEMNIMELGRMKWENKWSGSLYK